MLANVTAIMAEVQLTNAYISPGRIVSRYWAISGERPDGLTMSEMFQTVVAADLVRSASEANYDLSDDILSQHASE